MNRTDLWILAILLEQQADRFMIAMSIDEIIEAGGEDIVRITVYKHLKKLLDSGYVATGAKSDRASCFYITDKGKEILNMESKV